MLKDLIFSDLLLMERNLSTSLLKGTPEFGHALVAVDEQVLPELDVLLGTVKRAYEDKDPSTSLRVTHDGIAFRAAMYADVDAGNVFFLRRIPDSVPSLRSLGLPSKVVDWLLEKDHSRGLLLVSGPQASGKTTTAGALIAARLALHGGHGVTYEHPVEMPLAGRHGEHGYCFQAEISSEAEIPAHIERTHRYGSPNIIFVGEIRTKYAAGEVLRVALGSNQQLVVATIHGMSAKGALDRLLAWARETDGNAAQLNLAATLTGILQLNLIFDVDGSRHLDLPEFLLLSSSDDSANVVRTKIRDGNLFLDAEFRQQRNQFKYQGHL
jgi:twitching motility protein PilT